MLVASPQGSAGGASDAGRPGAGGPGAELAATCAGLGAHVLPCPVACDTDTGLAGEALQEALEQAAAAGRRIALLAIDAAGVFAQTMGARRVADADGERGADVGVRALRACLEESWVLTRTLAEEMFLKHGLGGRIVYVAPPPDAGEHARAALAGLENLARTLSIEWARHQITAVTIAPGVGAGTAGEVAAITAYLASPAGAYFSGCLLDLRGPAAG